MILFLLFKFIKPEPISLSEYSPYVPFNLTVIIPRYNLLVNLYFLLLIIYLS